MLRKLILLVVAITGSLFLWKALAAGPAATPNAPSYTTDKKLLKPANYREWVYLSSGLGMNYSAPATGMAMSPAFTNVFVQPEAYREFMKSGAWPDKTIFALEVYSSASHGSINKAGHYQDTLMAVEAEVKDSSTPEVWRYYNFGAERTEAEAFPKGACFSCHDKNAAVEHSFVQFYPQLLDVAFKKGTIKAGIDIPLNSKRFSDIIVEKGWGAAQQAYVTEKQKNPQSELTDEHNLIMLGSALFDRKKTAEAVSVFELNASEHPSSAVAYATLGEAYAQTNQRQAAIDATNKSLALAEKDTMLSDADKKELRDGAQRRLAQLNK